MNNNKVVKVPKIHLPTLALVSSLSQKIVKEQDHSSYKQQETMVVKGDRPEALGQRQ